MAMMNNLLLQAVQRDDLRGIHRLVHEGADVNYRDSKGATAMHRAADLGKKHALKCLVRLGGKVNARTKTQWTPLHMVSSTISTKRIMRDMIPVLDDGERQRLFQWSENLEWMVNQKVEEEKIEMIDCLLRLGADKCINAECDTGVTSMHLAIQKRNIGAVEILAQLGLAKTTPLRISGGTALNMALQEEQKEVMKYLVHKGAKVDTLMRSVPLLHEAVKAGDVNIVETLLKHGADVEAKSRTLPCQILDIKHFGTYTCLANLGVDFNKTATISTAIHEVAALNKPAMLDCFVRYGCKFKDCEKEKITAITQAALSNKLDLLEHLVQCGADINFRYTPYSNVMTEAVRAGNTEMVQVIAKNGFPYERRPLIQRSTAIFHITQSYLMEADISKLRKILDVMVRLGADINDVKCDYTRALEMAVLQKDINMVKCIMNLNLNTVHGIAYVNDARGVSLLNWILILLTHAKKDGANTDIVNFLVEAGADVNSEFDEVPPIIIAIKHSNLEIVKSMVQETNDKSIVRIIMGQKPIHVVCQSDKLDILRCLIQHGADINAAFTVLRFNVGLLEAAIHQGNTATVEAMLDVAMETRIPLKDDMCRFNPLSLLVMYQRKDMLSHLLKAGADLKISSELLNKRKSLLDMPILPLTAYNLGIFHTESSLPQPHLTLLGHSIASFYAGSEIVEVLLSAGANKEKNSSSNLILLPEHKKSDLQVACEVGDFDTIRLLIADGSNVHERDSYGKQAFEYLPLACSIHYNAFKETQITEKVIEQVINGDQSPLPNQTMVSLLHTPGIGDICSITRLNSIMICDGVHKMIRRFTGTFQRFPDIVVIRCGSAAERTKVGLPDEMDFLAEVAKLDIKVQSGLEDAGNGFVYYSGKYGREDLLQHGSKFFHGYFSHEMVSLKNYSTVAHGCEFIFVPLAFLITSSNRKATSPLILKKQVGESTLTISVDVVPCLHVPNSWPDDFLQRSWLMNQQELKSHGYYLVTKPPHVRSQLAKEYSPTDLERLWRISFSHLETYHMQHLEQRVKDVYLLAKCLRNPDACRIMVTDDGSYPRNMDKYVTSYMLKMIFFKNVEYFLKSDLSLGEMVCHVYEGVAEGLAKGFIPLYFMPKVNAIGGLKLDIPKCAKVANILNRFVQRWYERDSCMKIEDVKNFRRPASVYRSIEIGCPDGTGWCP